MREMFKRFSAGCTKTAPDFWSDADVGNISTAARSLYGQDAKTAAAWCALCARYGSEYVRELIRHDKERQHLRDLLLEGASSETTEPVDATYFDSLRARASRQSSK